MRFVRLFCLFLSFVTMPCFATENPAKDPAEYYWKEEVKKEALEQNRLPVLVTKMILILGITICIALLVSFLAKKFFAGKLLSLNSNARIRVIERKAISPKASIVIVELDDEELFIAETQNSLTVLSKQKIANKEELQ